MSRTQTSEVSIVGGGPVGLGLAIELGRRGIEVVVIEKERDLHNIPKGQNLTQRTMEHFRVWGVEDEIRNARVMPPGYPAAGVNAWDHLLGDHSHPWFRRSQVSAYYFAANERLPQYLTERVLRSRCQELESVSVIYGESVSELTTGQESVIVTTPERSIRSRWVVGCDGSRSAVRELAGIEEEVRDHDRRMALLVFRSPELADILQGQFGEAAFFNVLHPDLDGYWRFLGIVEVGKSWFFHAPVGPDTTADDLDHEFLLRETVGADFAIDLDYVGFWDLRVAIANDYRAGRVFLAGDAAHSHPPYGGYGINTGFEDARNLGWKLAATIQGWGGDRLLDSYSFERRAVFESTAEHFIEGFINRDRQFIAATRGLDSAEFSEAWEERRTGSRFGVSDYAPHYEGSPVIVGKSESQPSAVGVHGFNAEAGHHLPPLDSDPDLFEKLGDRLTLVTSSGNTAPDLDVTLVTEPGGKDRYEAEAVLVRPDHFVAFAGDFDELTAQTLKSALGF